MKKMFTLLVIAAALMTGRSSAQTCNAGFDFNFLNTYTVKFNPAVTTDSPMVQHYWYFDDGGFSQSISPAHSYASAGTYHVKHFMERYTPNGVFVCSDSLVKVVTIQQAPCNVQAAFTSAPSTSNPLEIHFTNTSTGTNSTDSVFWSFGDGTYANSFNAAHTYQQSGVFTVCLRIKRMVNTVPCISDICKTIIVAGPCNIQAAFNVTASSNNPLEKFFNNTSVNVSNVDTVTWNFGDGTTSNMYSTSHTFPHAGTYNVCLRIKRYDNGTAAPCVREICQSVVVGTPCNLQANFTSVAAAGNPREIHFTNTTVNQSATDTVRWTFGDGTSAVAANPTHVYAQSGTYTVCLRVARAVTPTAAPCVSEICKTINIQQVCNIQASYSWRRDSLNYKKIYFTNLSVVPTANATATWTFGDGTTASSWNATHEYAQPGWYNVCLRVKTSDSCFATYCDSVRIEAPAPPCSQLANYHFDRVGSDPQRFVFTPNYIANAIQYTWTFGDGTGSHAVVANHRFATAGTYTTCLTAYRDSSCASTNCKTITVAAGNGCDTASTGYWYSQDPVQPNKYYFHAYSTVNIIDQVWTIIKVGGSVPPVVLHQNDPAYVFSDTGRYEVCLKVTLAGGCIKNYCQVVYVTQGANACELQAYPNPASTVVKVNVTLAQAQPIYAYVYNSANVQVMAKQQAGVAGTNVVELGIGNLVAGMYTIKLIYGNNTCLSRFTKL